MFIKLKKKIRWNSGVDKPAGMVLEVIEDVGWPLIQSGKAIHCTKEGNPIEEDIEIIFEEE